MKPDRKTIDIVVSDELVFEAVVDAMHEERISFRQSREQSREMPADCDQPFILVKGADYESCIGIAEFLASEMGDVMYCGPIHPHEKACIGNKIERAKKEYLVTVRPSAVPRNTAAGEVVELHVKFV